MKLNKSNLFVLVWVTHLFIYYATYLSAIAIAFKNYSELYKVFFGFAIGLFGWPIKQLPLFFVIPLLLMLILIKRKLNEKWFIAYVSSICFAYLIKYIWLFFNYKDDIMLGYPEPVNTIYFILPSLIVSITCNWLIFKKQYEKFGV